MDHTLDRPGSAGDGVHDLYPGRSRAVRPGKIRKGKAGKICDRMNIENVIKNSTSSAKRCARVERFRPVKYPYISYHLQGGKSRKTGIFAPFSYSIKILKLDGKSKWQRRGRR